jgi:hypothetical protein
MQANTRYAALVGCAFGLTLSASVLAAAPGAGEGSPADAGGAEGKTATAAPSGEVSGGRAGLIGINLSMAYLTYGMNDVNNGFLNGRSGGFRGDMGYGVELKYGLSRAFTAKMGVDFLLARADSSLVANGVLYSSRLDLPATMLSLGGDYVIFPTPAMDVKLGAAFILVSIFNGNEKSASDSTVDLGTISGSTQGLQLGAGLEMSLGRGFSIEGDLNYNFARIDRATFSGPPSDPGSAQVNGVVDYSGLMAKLALTVYLLP